MAGVSGSFRVFISAIIASIAAILSGGEPGMARSRSTVVCSFSTAIAIAPFGLSCRTGSTSSTPWALAVATAVATFWLASWVTSATLASTCDVTSLN